MAKPKIVVHDPFEDYRAEAAASPSNAQAQANLGWGYYAKGKKRVYYLSLEFLIGRSLVIGFRT